MISQTAVGADLRLSECCEEPGFRRPPERPGPGVSILDTAGGMSDISNAYQFILCHSFSQDLESSQRAHRCDRVAALSQNSADESEANSPQAKSAPPPPPPDPDPDPAPAPAPGTREATPHPNNSSHRRQ